MFSCLTKRSIGPYCDPIHAGTVPSEGFARCDGRHEKVDFRFLPNEPEQEKKGDPRRGWGLSAGDLDGFGGGKVRMPPIGGSPSIQIRFDDQRRPNHPRSGGFGVLCPFIETNCLAPSWLGCGRVESSVPVPTFSAPPLLTQPRGGAFFAWGIR
jgi:hypothetical protein